MRTRFTLLVLLGLCLFIGCSGLKKAQQHPLVGMWAYSIDTPQGILTGMLSVTEADGQLAGVFRSDSDGTETTLDAIIFEEGAFSLEMTSAQYGKITAQATLEGDTFDGTMDVVEFGVTDMAFTGTRQAADDAGNG